MLPSGPAPLSLQDLSLDSEDDDYDLTLHLAWAPCDIRHVKLAQYARSRPNLERLARGTVKLTVSPYDDNHVYLKLEHSANVSHTVHLCHGGISDCAALLAAVQPALDAVQSVIISHTALESFSSVLEALPKLEHLVVHIEPGQEHSWGGWSLGPLAFDWRPLACMASFTRKLRNITLQVSCGRYISSCAPSPDDARSLIAIIPRDLPPVEIQGFAAAVVAEIDVTGRGVRFDVTAKVGKLEICHLRDTYYPFNNGR